MSKEAICVVLDVGTSMAKEMSDGKTRLEMAKDYIRMLVQAKLLFGGKTDKLAMVYYGCNDTNNKLNEEHPGYYENIQHVHVFKRPDLDVLETLADAEPEDAEGDVLDALFVGLELIVSEVRHLKFKKRIFLVTDGGGATKDTQHVEALAREMAFQDVRLNVIGIGFTEEESDDEDGDEMEEDDQKESKRTENEIANEKLLRKLAHDADGEVFVGSQISDALNFIRKRSVKQVHKYKGPMNIGKMTIEIATYGKTAMQNMPTLKKSSRPAEEGVSLDTSVKMERGYWNKLGSDNVEVTSEFRVKAYPYGKQLVPFLKADEALMKYMCDKTLSVIAFAPRDKIKRYWCLGSVDCVLPLADMGLRNALKFSALVQALNEEKAVAIARYVKRKNAQPLFVVMTPEINESMECLYLNQLPFSEDVRDFMFGSFDEKQKPTQEQKLAMRSLIRKMDLTKMIDSEGYEFEGLIMEETQNPTLQRFYQNVEKRALDEEAPIEDLEPAIAESVKPDVQLLKNAHKELEEIKRLFKLEVVEKVQKRKKRHWRDYLEDADISSVVDDDMAQAKKLKADAKAAGDDLNMDDIVAVKVDQVSSATPVADLQAMASRKDDVTAITRGISQMWKIINDFVQSSYGTSTFPKAIECLTGLREVCKVHQEAKGFNSGIESLSKSFKSKKSFWDMVVGADMKPISKKEDPASTYTEDQAKEFLTMKNEPEPEPDQNPVSELSDFSDLE